MEKYNLELCILEGLTFNDLHLHTRIFTLDVLGLWIRSLTGCTG